MTTDRGFERNLPTILEDLYLGPSPDYRDEVLAAATGLRQRPAWTFAGRWLPMAEIARGSALVPRLPWRSLGLALVILALLIAAAFVYIGSRETRLPPPFGVARNGAIAYAADGDIFMADPMTGATSAIVVSPATDVGPVYSLDGTRVAFERKINGGTGPGWLFVARVDGRGLVQVTPEPLPELAEWSFSPDGGAIVALVHSSLNPQIMIVRTDGTGQPRLFDVKATTFDGPPRYRPDGSEIMVIGQQPGATTRGLYALDPVSGDVRTIIAPSATADIHSAAWSPDGTRIAYAAFDPNVDTRSTRTHVVSVDGTGDVLVDTHPDTIADGGSVWSNDGTRLVINRFYAGGANDIARSAIVPIDRSSIGIDIDCATGAPPGDCTADWIWSPDDSVLVGAASDANNRPMPQILADPLTGKIRSAPWTATGYPAWQRRAP